MFKLVIWGKVCSKYLKSFIKKAVEEINIVNDKRLYTINYVYYKTSEVKL